MGGYINDGEFVKKTYKDGGLLLLTLSNLKEGSCRPKRLRKYRAVANGPVGPAMAGPIIEPVILFFLNLFIFYFIFFPTGPIIEPVILIFAICVNTDSPKTSLGSFCPSRN